MAHTPRTSLTPPRAPARPHRPQLHATHAHQCGTAPPQLTIIWIQVRCDPFFTDFEFYLHCGPQGQRERVKGLYFITDGGYHKWRALQCVEKSRSEDSYRKWRRLLERVRKDSECMFGRLKNRFRILKTPIMFHLKERIDNLFLTCVALHNIIHVWDTELRNTRGWEVNTSSAYDLNLDDDADGNPPTDGMFQDEVEGGGEDDGQSKWWCRPELRTTGGLYEQAAEWTDFSGRGTMSFPLSPDGTPIERQLDAPFTPFLSESPAEFRKLQQQLVNHYSYHRSQSGSTWLRSDSLFQQNT